MGEMENIRRYIRRTRQANGKLYQMNLAEMFAMARAAKDAPGEMICLAFDYGRAKGYRGARAENKKGE